MKQDTLCLALSLALLLATALSSCAAPSTDIVMVPVPGGTFQRSAVSTDKTVVSAFSISQHEITRAQFLSIMGVDPVDALFSSGMNDPVLEVTWFQAIAFCNKLSLKKGLNPAYTVEGIDFQKLAWKDIASGGSKTWDTLRVDWHGNGYRLPTEMEWIWAYLGARNDTNGLNKACSGSNGTHDTSTLAWFDGNSAGKSHPVGTLGPNELGLYDMSGNAEEWLWDWWGPLPEGTLRDYSGPDKGRNKVIMGGSWNCSVGYMDLSHDIRMSPGSKGIEVGFRVVKR